LQQKEFCSRRHQCFFFDFPLWPEAAVALVASSSGLGFRHFIGSLR